MDACQPIISTNGLAVVMTIVLSLLINFSLLVPSELDLCFEENTPLFYLGYISYKISNEKVLIKCSKETAAVCTLFVELCHDVGLQDRVALSVLKNVRHPSFERMGVDCVGVVTARCDVDSALDTLLASSTRYPWRLSRVLVQEAAMERFARALQWKTRNADENTIKLLLDYVGEDSGSGVPVEAFRSVREALALLASLTPLAVSLWSSDVAEANEISFSADVKLVWLNGYGHFHGAPAAAALYGNFASNLDTQKCSQMHDVLGVRKLWLDLAPTRRLALVLDALDKFHEASATRIDVRAVGLRTDYAVASATGIWTLFRKPTDIILISVNNIHQSYPRFLNYLVDGGAAVIVADEAMGTKTDAILILSHLLSEAGAPVRTCKVTEIPSPLTNNSYCPMYKKKAIWTSMGTVFAN